MVVCPLITERKLPWLTQKNATKTELDFFCFYDDIVICNLQMHVNSNCMILAINQIQKFSKHFLLKIVPIKKCDNVFFFILWQKNDQKKKKNCISRWIKALGTIFSGKYFWKCFIWFTAKRIHLHWVIGICRLQYHHRSKKKSSPVFVEFFWGLTMAIFQLYNCKNLIAVIIYRRLETKSWWVVSGVRSVTKRM